jgi:biotin carboxylase
MAHLLIVELPGGNDTDLLQAAKRLGHSFTFLTQDLATYQKLPEVFEWVEQAFEVIESKTFEYDEIERLVDLSNSQLKIDAILCLLDIRLIEAARLAEKFGLKYLNPSSAVLLRDKYSVRERLNECGIEQPDFMLATTNVEVKSAIEKIGLPLLMKPSDGYGSQNILTIETDEDLALAADTLDNVLPLSTDYGLGVRSNDRLLIERYMHGLLIGCDTFTSSGVHRLLGVNEKLMFGPPSFAIRGGCFTPNQGDWHALEAYVFSILDAVRFDYGAAHIEIMLTDQGPRLVEINPRLVGAKIARLVGFSLGCSVHEELINLHLGKSVFTDLKPETFQPSVTRWLVSPFNGRIEQLALPTWQDDGVKCVELLVKTGDAVSYPFENSQRLGYVMTSCPTRAQAEALADKFWAESKLIVN